jgi:hypothetical protein
MNKKRKETETNELTNMVHVSVGRPLALSGKVWLMVLIQLPSHGANTVTFSWC